mgnify:CR=1 FL=1
MHAFFDFFFQNREMVFIVILSIFLGIEVIAHVPSVLHTPLMSGANAIHGVVIIGAINWGMVGGLNMDLVKMISMGHGDIERYMKIAVGVAGFTGDHFA